MNSFTATYPPFPRLILITIIAFTSYVHAQGKGNVTVKQFGEATFASEPHGRGTTGILISCTTTFIFCIWTAVHPNIVPGVTTIQRVYYKGMLMLLSILIPEGLVVCATGEFLEARRLKKAWRECRHIKEDFKGYMDMQVAYFVVMGGFIVDDEEHEDGGTKTKYRARLTPTGFRTYLNAGLIDERSFVRADIADKGKASAFGKFVSIVQACWLIVQSLSRLYSRLPLSILEIHVLIQVIRTAFIYGLWWRKPLDVKETITIRLFDPEEKKGETSFSNDKAVETGQDRSHHDAPNDIKNKETQDTTLQGGKSKETTTVRLCLPAETYMTLDEISKPLQDGRLEQKIEESARYQRHQPLIITEHAPRNFVRFCNKAIYDIVFQLDFADQEKNKTTRQTDTNTKDTEPDSLAEKGLNKEHLPRVSTSRFKVMRRFRFSLAIFAESFMVCLNGGLHAIVWNKAFPTSIERWLWRGASLTMCFCWLWLFLIANFTESEQALIRVMREFHIRRSIGFWATVKRGFYDVNRICRFDITEEHEERRREDVSYILHLCAVILALNFAFAYFLSVSYITVESYLDLRRAPADMWLTASWSDYWPHL